MGPLFVMRFVADVIDKLWEMSRDFLSQRFCDSFTFLFFSSFRTDSSRFVRIRTRFSISECQLTLNLIS